MPCCGHTFAWHSVVPPSHCLVCGACLHCGSRPAPVTPYPTYPTWPPSPWYSTTVTSTTS